MMVVIYREMKRPFRLIRFNEMIAQGETLGQMIAREIEKDPGLTSFITPYTKEIPQHIDLANAIDISDEQTKVHILRTLREYKGEMDTEVRVSTTDTDLVSESAGKGIFNTFLKTLTSLGHKNNTQSTSVPQGFIIFFEFPTDSGKLKEVFGRFRSLTDSDTNKSHLYYGIKPDLTLEYGTGSSGDMVPIGTFRLTKGIFDKLLSSPTLALSGFKEVFKELSYSEFSLICSLHRKMESFNPTGTKSAPTVKNRTYTLSFKGFGLWENGVQSKDQLESFMNLIKSHLVGFPKRDNFRVKMVAKDYWTSVVFILK